MWSLLKSMNKNVTVVNSQKILKSNFSFLKGFEKIREVLPKNCDLLIYFDCSNDKRAEIVSQSFTINIDHHIDNSNFGDINIVMAHEPSTSVVVYKLLEACKVTINRDCATALYSALVSDSGFFAFERTSKESFLVAAKLVESGANPSEIAQHIRFSQSLCSLRLLSLALQSLELMFDARVGVITISSNMLKRCGASMDDCEGVVNYALSLHCVEVALIFIEELDLKYRISLRSKGAIEVNRVAQIFGGGGHKSAAGLRVEGDLDLIKKRLLEEIREHLK